MLRRRISNYDGDADDGKEIGAKVAFKGTTDKVESVDSNVTGGKPAKTEPTERPQRDTKRDSTRTGKRDNAGKPNQSRASSGPRNDRPSGVNRQVPVPKTIEVDKEGDYVDTGVALPGDVVGIAEEFKAGKNTYKRGGNIIATTTGTIRENHKKMVISVIPATSTPPIINIGDIVIGKVFRVKDSVILLEVDTKKGAESRNLLTIDFGEIHVSNISNSYIKDTRNEFSQFDIVKAKVIDANSMRLSTADDDCGVLKALCSKCLTALNLMDKKLGCPSCGNMETRKISSKYGTGII